ncbi:hypothetical protein SD70_02490 [Gordoniibacillus kamchatkensis]|uniref:Phosphoprotein n=1 Tax=Gordoniibacillus kamchatkensis TaxID=1590651 RepID=A0ABR5AM22_9BACL|nr:hypothetical protein [Paenibacillus sp. VKM B-2647]KIL42071.1 hypothetical protein SD70_02490 [Paenibacillus sp. VKM B-2647]
MEKILKVVQGSYEPRALNLQMFAAAGEGKTKLEKHLEELGENTSGGAHDAVTFSGKGLSFLNRLFKSATKKKPVDDEDDDYDDDEDELDKNANGGDLEEEDEDPDDPADKNGDDIISNRGQRKPKDSLQNAVSKSMHFDEIRFEKSVEDEFGDILDATPALAELAKSMKALGKSMNGAVATIQEVQEQNLILAKAVRELLKSQAAMAADLELVKKQPATSPATGFVVLNKGEGGKGRKLSKSEIEDSLTDLMNAGMVDPRTVSRLSYLRSDSELREFVDSLPQSVREKL